MFERFTEDARRALFFAREKTVQRNGDSITPEDLLGGIVWATPNVIPRLGAKAKETMTPTEKADDFMSRLSHDKTLNAHTRREVPFCQATRLALQAAAEEADELGHNAIRPEHLLLGLLRDESTQASHTLREAGVTLRELRRMLADEPGEQDR
ncbi:MAG: Clp protease N-terminal domain-containing protein [Gemmatimonadaceae bacterium]